MKTQQQALYAELVCLMRTTTEGNIYVCVCVCTVNDYIANVLLNE